MYSPWWYRVADLKPRLRPHTRIHRHNYRGQLWYVLQDSASARLHRFTPSAYALIGLMDGRSTVDEIWEAAHERLAEQAPTQDEAIALMSQLHRSDMLQSDAQPDGHDLSERLEQSASSSRRRFLNPLSLRFALVDPERLLVKLLPLFRVLFSWPAFAIWLGVVSFALMLAAKNAIPLTEYLDERAFTTRNLIMLWLAYPVTKLLHELAHAGATRVWGGEVHEMGITFLVLTPVPYVDASASAAIPEKSRRLVVSAAGMMIELFLAAIALALWLNLQDGILRDLMFDVMLIAGVSTLLFNANPLLRFDGYYMLADLIEIPNLGTRANRYVGYLTQRYLFGVKEARSPARAPGERPWFLFYAVAAFFNRLVIAAVIALFLASKFFFVGVALACWALFMQIVLPVARHIAFLLFNPALQGHRFRAIGEFVLVGAVLATLVTVVPVPVSTHVEGVVWMPEQSRVRAGTDGTIERLLSEPDAIVSTTEPLIVTADSELEFDVRILESRRAEARSRYDATRITNRARAQILLEDIELIEDELATRREQLARLVIESPASGRFVVPDASRLLGRYVRQGDVLGYVTELSHPRLRVVIAQSDIDRVRQQTRAVEVKFASHLADTVSATVVQEVPAADRRLPSKVLGAEGGGRIAVDSRDREGTLALEEFFQLELQLVEEPPVTYYGERLYVRFRHDDQPLAQQWYRLGRQLFLSKFGV